MFQIIEQRNLGYFELRERLIIPFSLWCLASCISLANQDFVRQPASLSVFFAALLSPPTPLGPAPPKCRPKSKRSLCVCKKSMFSQSLLLSCSRLANSLPV